MKTKENKKKKVKKSQLKLVGFLLILIGLSILLYKLSLLLFVYHDEEKKIYNFIEMQDDREKVNINAESKGKLENSKQDEQYVALLEIPKIKLKKGLYDVNSSLNDVDKNIQILKESDLPDKENGNVILAGHSGNGAKAYFQDLVKLDSNDIATIIYNKKKYSYKLVDKYEIEKTGTAMINCSMSTKTLTLITCKKDSNKQIVFIFEETKESDFNG